MNIVIAGFGVTGATAAEIARKQDPKAQITIFSKEKDLFYYRPRLPEVVSGDVEPEKIYAHPPQWYAERNIELRMGESLAEVYLDDKVIRGSTGSRQYYDRLLLAMGAESNRPSLPGSELEGIFAIRCLRDAWALNLAANGKKKAVLVGGGLLGLELGAALASHGIEVTVLERGDRLLPRQTTPKSAEILISQLTPKGLKFELGMEVGRFEGTREVETVLLKDGRELPADLVLISAGITPNVNLALSLGIETDRAILVNEFMETSQKDIFAAGDCAQFPEAMGGLWTTSREQALVAGHNLAARKAEERKAYVPAPPNCTLKVAGIDLVTAGNLDPEEKLQSIEASEGQQYRKIILDAESRLVGYTIVGTTKGSRELKAALAAKKEISQTSQNGLKALDFDFSQISN